MGIDWVRIKILLHRWTQTRGYGKRIKVQVLNKLFRDKGKYYHWLQLSIQQSKELEEKDSISKNCYYEYFVGTNTMRENYIETNNILQNYIP